MDSAGDADKRIADLQRQLDQERQIAELQRQLAQARSERVQGRPFEFGSLPGPSRTTPDTRLSAAPRAVPARFVLAELLPFRWWYLTVMFVVAVPAVIVWIMTPAAGLPAAICTVVLIYAWHLRGALTRLRLLRWGQVATVTDAEVSSQASYFGGTTWYNAPLPIAEGWHVSRRLWSGPSTETLIRYTLNGYRGELSVRGREYLDGVILADERDPERAKCVTYFPYDLDRTDNGDWKGTVRPRLMLGMTVWLVIVCVWLVGAAAISTGYATRALQKAQTITIEAGDSAQVSGNGLTRDVVCHGGNLTVDGNENVVTVVGHCAGVTVAGFDHTVVLDSADSITVSGIGGHVTYHSGTPAIANNGINTSVVHR